MIELAVADQMAVKTDIKKFAAIKVIRVMQRHV